jgi:hypothetical protein
MLQEREATNRTPKPAPTVWQKHPSTLDVDRERSQDELRRAIGQVGRDGRVVC